MSNGHVWVRFKDPSDVERVRAAFMVKAAELGMTWVKPRFSQQSGETVGGSLTTIIDTSVLTPGRLVFCGKPVAGEGLRVLDSEIELSKGLFDESVDTSVLTLPGPDRIREITKAAGVELHTALGQNGLKTVVYDLSLGMELVTQKHGVISVGDAARIGGTIRCQSPFRASDSWACLFSVDKHGSPLVYDFGTCTTHRVPIEYEFNVVPVDEQTVAHEPVRQGSLPVPAPAPFRGVMADIVSATLKASPLPQPELATMAILIGMAAGCSGHYHMPSGARLNLYGAGIAGTGWGKDMPRTAAVEIAKVAGARIIGKPASGAGLEDVLAPWGNILSEIDEVAHYFEAINGHNAASYLVDVAGCFLKLFSASGNSYSTRVKAAVKGTATSTSIPHPCVNLLAFSTPEKLGSALTISNIEDGLLGRMLFAMGRGDVVMQRKQMFIPPDYLKTRADTIAMGELQATLEGNVSVSVTPDADELLFELQQEFHKKGRGAGNPLARSLLTRSYEKCERIAGVLAVWDAPSCSVTVEHVNWAKSMVEYSDDVALRFCGEFLHNGQVQADAAFILKTTKRVLSGEIKVQRSSQLSAIKQRIAPRSSVLSASKLDKKRFDAAVDYLVDLEEIVTGTQPVSNAKTLRLPVRS